MKAADVSDEAVIGAVRNRGQYPNLGLLRHELEAAFPDVPPKVLRAKVRKLIRRGVIDGCACGCRGEFVMFGDL
jgi:hypothetical protein